jgi:predicted N-acetyltransferase YhbS
MLVRRAGLDDLRALFELALTFHREFPNLPAVDTTKTYLALRSAVAKGAGFLAETDQPAGMLVLVRAPYWFSQAEALWDQPFYVRPEYRGSRAAPSLIALAKQESAKAGLPLVMATSSGVAPDKMDLFFARMGFARMGGVYEYRT